MDWSYNILGPDPFAGLMVVLILILIEGILSVDNAAVLATMVMRLPPEQRSKALRYGILGAYVFRGISSTRPIPFMPSWPANTSTSEARVSH